MINSAGSCHLQANTIKQELDKGSIVAHLPIPLLSEIYYITLRVYSQLKKDLHLAKKLIDWLITHDNVIIYPLNMNLILRAGEIKHSFSISIMDSFNFALAQLMGKKLIFKSNEREFSDDLLKQFDIIFLDQI